jgi:hypothetical protein
MSETTYVNEGPAIGALHEVRGRFNDPAAMQRAVEWLEISGFDRADLSLPEAWPPRERTTPESGAKPAEDEADARQARTLHTSGAAAVAGLAAAGAVVATGGAAAPAVAAAVVGGGLAGAAVHALSSVSNSSEQEDRARKAALGALILSVRAPSDEKRCEAEAVLRSAGAIDVEVAG